MGSRVKRFNVPGAAIIIAIVAVWEIVILTGLIAFDNIPAPHQVALGFWELLVDGSAFYESLWHTIWVLFTAWLLALLVGIPLGLALGSFPRVWQWSMATVDMMRALPVIALIPVGFLIFGISAQTEFLLAAYSAFWPIVVNTTGGVRSVHPRLYEVAQQTEIGTAQRLWKIVLPASLPEILVGARVSLTLSLVVTVVTEMIGNPEGLGSDLIFARDAFRPDQMWTYLILMGLIGLCLNGLILLISKTLLKGFPKAEGSAA